MTISVKSNFKIAPLTKKLAIQHADEICISLDQIPLVSPHTKEKLIADSKGNRVLHKKWDHSLVALQQNKYAGVIIGYERDAEENKQYPRNSIHIKSFAVSANFQRQGLGRLLISSWLDYNKKLGFLHLDGDLCFSVQTNSAHWNQHVQKLYESFGFKKTSTKQYENRTDNVYFL